MQGFDKNPVPGVRISIKGTVFTTYTNKNGEFSFGKAVKSFLSNKNAALILCVSKECFISREVNIERLQPPLRIEMEPKLLKIGQMEEVIVTASGLDKTGFYI